MTYWQKQRELRAQYLTTVVQLLTNEPALAPGGAIHNVRANIEQVRLVLEQQEGAGAAPLASLEGLAKVQELLEKFMAALRSAREEAEAAHDAAVAKMNAQHAQSAPAPGPSLLSALDAGCGIRVWLDAHAMVVHARTAASVTRSIIIIVPSISPRRGSP